MVAVELVFLLVLCALYSLRRSGMTQLANHPRWCMAMLFLLPIAMRLALLYRYPVPTPYVSDDFVQMLSADTLLHLSARKSSASLPPVLRNVFYPAGTGVQFHVSLGAGYCTRVRQASYRKLLGRSVAFHGRVRRPVLLDASRVGLASLGAVRWPVGCNPIWPAVRVDE